MAKLVRITLRVALIALLLGSLVVWAQSYWLYDMLSLGRFEVSSESGAIYCFPTVERFDHYMTGIPGENGRMEVETGSTYLPWLPVRTWTYGGNRLWSSSGGRSYWAN